MRRSLLVLFLVTACKTAEPLPPPKPPPVVAAPAAPVKPEQPTLRLPPGAKPTRYELSLRVVPGESKFTGEVTIELELDRPLSVLWLNARGLQPQSAEFTVNGATISATAENAGEQFMFVTPATKITAPTATLKLRYEAELSAKNTSGLFQAKEGDDPYAITEFEPLDARRAFPCFDEPAFKVPWRLTLHVKKEHRAFHNTPIEQETDEADGMKAVRFAQTRPMPSYLVAFAVGPFETVDAGSWGKNKTKVRIVTPRGKSAEAKYAAESTGPILEQLEKYFGTPYPFEKLDLLALPVDAGAMENPGLVTWGYRLLLVKPQLDNLNHQRDFASTCAHELAHMWFGDLVTMAWWDDLWLNEAFATWMESKIIEAWKPRWDVAIERVEERGSALNMDTMVTARRIRQPIEADDDIVNAFDVITYTKGAAVIGMFEAWAGPDAFQKGVRKHLEAHAWGNATATQFLEAISTEAGKDVSAPFSTFLDRAGAPRVSMELVCKPGETPKLELNQRRQLPVGSKGSAAQEWQVPICVRYSVKGKEARACTLLTQVFGTLPLEAKSCPEWVMPNDGMRGYYRASLGGSMNLVTLLKKAGSKLTIAERVGLLEDVTAAVDAGDVEVATALAVIPFALAGDNRHLLGAAQSIALELDGDLLPEALRPRYQAFIRGTFGARALKLGLEVGKNDSEDVRLSRPWLESMVAITGNEPVLRAKGLGLAKKWLSDRKAVHPDLVDTVLRIAADQGDPAFHEALVSALKTETDRAERGHLYGALAHFRDPALVKAHLGLTLDDSLDVREAMRVLWGASSDYRTHEVVMTFLQEHWDALVARLPEDSAAGLVWLGGSACEPRRRDAVKVYFEGRSTKALGGQREFDQALEAIDLCIAWRAKHHASAERFISSWSE